MVASPDVTVKGALCETSTKAEVQNNTTARTLALVETDSRAPSSSQATSLPSTLADLALAPDPRDTSETQLNSAALSPAPASLQPGTGLPKPRTSTPARVDQDDMPEVQMSFAALSLATTSSHLQTGLLRAKTSTPARSDQDEAFVSQMRCVALSPAATSLHLPRPQTSTLARIDQGVAPTASQPESDMPEANMSTPARVDQGDGSETQTSPVKFPFATTPSQFEADVPRAKMSAPARIDRGDTSESQMGSAALSPVTKAAQPETPKSKTRTLYRNYQSDMSETQMTSAALSPASRSSQPETATVMLAHTDQDLDDDIESRYFDSGVSTSLLELHAAIEDETMQVQSSREAMGLPAHTRDVALVFIASLCRNIGAPFFFAEATSLLDAYCTRAPEKAQASLAATCIAIVGLVLSFYYAKKPFDLSTMVDAQSMAALSSAVDQCEISEDMANEIKSRQLCVLQSLNGSVKVPSLAWWVSMYASRFQLSIQTELEASLAWAAERSEQSANSILTMRSLAGGKTASRHIAAGLLAVNVARAGLIDFRNLCPAGVGVVQWQAMFLQSRLGTDVPVCRLAPKFADGIIAALTEACACSLEDMQTGSAAALVCIIAVVIGQRPATAAAG
eukprot:TRINITY_DN8484_c0_g2_i1.p1 TRINITY_DN8484_c0_g2~~TRINITY_DN8484_c0_g2_i1.p1  ORF type:complete len:623 (+),score=71.24 TRINITY_DN8484_c0_g2_i1:49-1917(+)